MKAIDKLKVLGVSEGLQDIEKDFSELYGSEIIYTSENSQYPQENTQAEWDACPFKLQSERLIEKLVEISGNQKFRELNAYLTQWTSVGATRTTNDSIKELAEHIYFQLLDAKRKGIDVEKTFSGLINNSAFICNEGGYTNLQNLSMAIDGGSKLIYNAKYEFIVGATREFLRQFQGQAGYRPGNEVHYVNQLITSIKQEYNLSPPPDMYANNQGINQLIATGKYREYIDSLFSSKLAANGMLGIMVNKVALQLQDEDSIRRKFDMGSPEDRYNKYQMIEIFQNVFRPYVDQRVLELIEYQLLDINCQTEDQELQGIYYLDIIGYKSNYLKTLEIIMADFLDKNGYLENVSFKFKDGNIVMVEDSVFCCFNIILGDNRNYKEEIDLRKLSELPFQGKKFVDVIRELLIKEADITNVDTLEKHLLSEEQLFENMDIVAIRRSIVSSLIKEIKQEMPDAKIPDKLLSIAEADLTKCLALLSDRVIKFYTVQDMNFSEQDFDELCELYDVNLQKFKALTSDSIKMLCIH